MRRLTDFTSDGWIAPLTAEGELLQPASQPGLFHVRIGTILPTEPTGADICLRCVGDADGRIYHCKDDIGRRRIRATEWIANSLAKHIGISVAEFAIIEDDTQDKTYFGSRSPISFAERFEMDAFIRTSERDEVGRPSKWLGQFFSRIWAFDLFVCNPDRSIQNFILDRDGQFGRICAIDYASSNLLPFPDRNFPIATSPTEGIGRIIRSRHGSHKAAAYEVLERIGSVPVNTLESIVTQMPEGWLEPDCATEFIEAWSDGRCARRLSLCRAKIADEWQG